MWAWSRSGILPVQSESFLSLLLVQETSSGFLIVTDAVWRKLNRTEEQIAWGVNSQTGLPDGGSSYCISVLAYEGLHAILINNPLVCWLVHRYWWLAGGGHFLISSWWGNGFGRNGAESRWGWTAVLPSHLNIIISIFGSGKYSWAGAGALGEASQSFPAWLQRPVSWSDKWSQRHILQAVCWPRVHTCEQRHMLAMHPNASIHVHSSNFTSWLRDIIETPRMNAAFVRRAHLFPHGRASRRCQHV